MSLWLYFVSLFLAELTSMKSFLTTALHLNTGACKADDSVPDPLLSSILQALSVQGELHKKIKLFGIVILKFHPLYTFILICILLPCK